MTEREALIAFNLVPDVGSVKADRLAAECGGSYVEAWERYPNKVDWQGHFPEWEKELERAARQKVRIVTRLDEEYPVRLKDLSSPPLALYVVGSVSALSRQSLSLIGTRACTRYGIDTAMRFATALSRSGWVVVSGLAMGIDAAAHQGAILGGGVTVGVLGGALDQFFPRENRPLAREMLERGGSVISEFPFGRKPDRTSFPQRNRIVAALSMGVIAVETSTHGGTLITTSLALDLHRNVMAVPGRVDSSASAGCNKLIRDGARLVATVDDVLEELNPLFKRNAIRPGVASAVGGKSGDVEKLVPPEVKLTLEEALVLRNVVEDHTAIDSVVRACGLPVAKVNSLLVSLRLKRKVKFLPGNRVSPI